MDARGPVPAAAAHPRRPLAHQSVSLRHSPPAKTRAAITLSTSPAAAASDRANPPSSLSPHHPRHHSSGESSDAAGWFERTNNDGALDAAFTDNDPPFLLQNSSSSDRTPSAARQPDLPYRTHLLPTHTDGSSTEDFRSVIDDLTVANRRLKQRLRKYERVHAAHLQDEKLFEVRFHRLPDHKKKELEATLRAFAAGLDDTADRLDPAHVPHLPKDPTASSASRFAESGYASMSASGQNSSTPSNGASHAAAADKKMTKSAYHRQQQTIHSYLHDIPLGLLPQDNAPMSDKARKKMVVRRLEQIFAGQRSAPGAHPHPMQQEEVAQSAATADRREREATGRSSRPEGQRTAYIMPDRPDDDDTVLHLPAQQRVLEQDFTSGSGSPDQRPTRPLDLDPYRAQVPAANMDYFRHLGFSPPNMTTITESIGEHGWLYLNLLINMAQLHTLNVTPDNVKDAIAQYSTRLEISPDGRKVRWRGGHAFSKTSSDGSPDDRADASPYQGAQRSPEKSSKTGNSTSIESGYGSEQRRSANAAPQPADMGKLAYKPLFFRRESSDEDVDFYDPTESADSPFQPQHGDSSGLGSSNLKSSLSAKRRDDGPMIFYNKAKFCTDLTGDRVGASLTLPENYKTITSHPLGAPSDPESKRSELLEPRGPLDDATMDSDSKSGTRTPSTLSFGFSPGSLQDHSGADSPDVMDFEVSGLGGVQPDDNFSIRVQRSQVPAAPAVHAARRPSLYPSKIQAILGADSTQEAPRRSTSPKVEQNLISAVHQKMPSSTLPPPSYFPFDSLSSGEASDDEDSSSETGDSVSAANDASNAASTNNPSTTLQLLNVAPPHYPGSVSEASEYSEDSDDGIIDLLATARATHPDTVRASEREYDAAVADRFAEEIAAGSSAATAGGGSGYGSPVSRRGRRSVKGVAGGEAERGVKRRGEDGGVGSGSGAKTRRME
ncbi:frequency clock protein [Boeremia exigua]|uniref:frequency clock protein n=1 Tax=Boeremia exigua TaxID=749465 RepID=UPI001E8EBCD5|nr:frequency clock protein [Boeremia exigua]KAH6643859.1 frequency clock protein [Boeremia exigua]